MKYLGGKFYTAKHILPVILKDRKPDQYYVEPFAGGMNVICNVDGPRIANDVLEPVIECWKALVNGWKPRKYTKEEYKHIRENRDLYPLHVVGWVGVACSFRGCYFEGFSGIRLSGIKRGVDEQQQSMNAAARQAKKLQGVEFRSGDYADLDIPPDSVVYCDPPYRDSYHWTRYKLKSYGLHGFDHDRFWQWCRETSQKHTVFISELDAPDDFDCVWSREKAYWVGTGLRKDGKEDGGKRTVIEKMWRYRG